MGHIEALEEVGTLVFAGATVLRMRVEVEGVVAGLSELAVPDYFPSEVGV